jgi:hypothetical protein
VAWSVSWSVWFAGAGSVGAGSAAGQAVELDGAGAGSQPGDEVALLGHTRIRGIEDAFDVGLRAGDDAVGVADDQVASGDGDPADGDRLAERPA